MGNGATIEEMRAIVDEAVDVRRDRGIAEAVHQAARDLGIPCRRLIGIRRGEIGKVWADELEQARRWYRAHCERQAERLAHEADRYRARAETLKRQIACF